MWGLGQGCGMRRRRTGESGIRPTVKEQCSIKTSRKERTIECAVCRRLFRREADNTRHKCSSEGAKPVNEQRGSVKCDGGPWFQE